MAQTSITSPFLAFLYALTTSVMGPGQAMPPGVHEDPIALTHAHHLI
ncbi:hypothetical protein [Vulcanisaeta distributa]|nr:hypothetical protein [Vulcanisaeta distributa]